MLVEGEYDFSSDSQVNRAGASEEDAREWPGEMENWPPPADGDAEEDNPEEANPAEPVAARAYLVELRVTRQASSSQARPREKSARSTI